MKKIILILSVLFLVLLILAGVFWWQEYKNDGKLLVYFLDVGQGDAIYIKAPDGQDILIDGGPDNSVIKELGKVMPFWDRQIDLVVLTHPDYDHVTGLVEVLKRYKIGQVLYTGAEVEAEVFLAFKEELADEEVILAENGQEFDFGEAKLKIIYATDIADNINDTSIISLLDFGETEFLFTGDAGLEVEKSIVDELEDVEVLKIGHHGSKNSTSRELLDKTNPEYSVIEVGEGNKFGHPNLSVLKMLEKADSSILRTDELGTIEFISNGKSLEYLVK